MQTKEDVIELADRIKAGLQHEGLYVVSKTDLEIISSHDSPLTERIMHIKNFAIQYGFRVQTTGTELEHTIFRSPV